MVSTTREVRSGKARFEPNITLQPNDRVIIHGAGELGREVYSYINDILRADIVAWVDRRHQELYKDVSSPECVFHREDFDIIIVAIKDENDAEEVRNYYVSGGGIT